MESDAPTQSFRLRVPELVSEGLYCHVALEEHELPPRIKQATDVARLRFDIDVEAVAVCAVFPMTCGPERTIWTDFWVPESQVDLLLIRQEGVHASEEVVRPAPMPHRLLEVRLSYGAAAEMYFSTQSKAELLQAA